MDIQCRIFKGGEGGGGGGVGGRVISLSFTL